MSVRLGDIFFVIIIDKIHKYILYSVIMQAIPFITLMIVVEAAINHFVRNKPQNLADRLITSHYQWCDY